MTEDVPVQQEEQQVNLYWKIFTTLRDVTIQSLILYTVMGFFKSNKSKNLNETKVCMNSFRPNQQLFYYIFASQIPDPNSYNSSVLIFNDDSFKFLEWRDDVRFTYTFPVTEELYNNGSFYLVICISSVNKLPHFSPQFGYLSAEYTCKIHEITRFKKLKPSGRKNLISGESTQKVSHEVITNHWHPNITISTLFDNRAFPCPNNNGSSGAQDFFSNELVMVPDDNSFFPIMLINDYWNLQADYQPITRENSTLNLTITISPISFMKWQFYLSVSLKNKFNIFEKEESHDDMLKKLLISTPLYLIVLTTLISLAHSFFEFLAFKNDIQFWNNKKDLTGLSVSNVLFGLFQSVVVFLYILDNQGNFMLVVGSGLGCLIDAWKITKVVDIEFDFARRIGPFPRILFKDKSTYVQSDTRKYDIMALKYLSVVLLPMFVGYSVYSLLYYEHKGWYSFGLSLVYGFLLTFGFIMMTPQLFINYKMKSVAHLPWRMLTYKALNTFIDDIFAFIIHMPTMYRLGCLRDDVVFFVYLYQRWVYPIDKTRVNEFGTTGETGQIMVTKEKAE